MSITCLFPADPGVPRDVFAIQMERVIENCVVAVFWRSPTNASGNINYEIIGYKIFANGINLSNDIIISDTSDDNEFVSTWLFVPDCPVHFISVSAVNQCGRAGPQFSSPVELDPEVRYRLPGPTYNTLSGSESTTGPGKNFFLRSRV